LWLVVVAAVNTQVAEVMVAEVPAGLELVQVWLLQRVLITQLQLVLAV
jgi:hypothetical protein